MSHPKDGTSMSDSYAKGLRRGYARIMASRLSDSITKLIHESEPQSGNEALAAALLMPSGCGNTKSSGPASTECQFMAMTSQGVSTFQINHSNGRRGIRSCEAGTSVSELEAWLVFLHNSCLKSDCSCIKKSLQAIRILNTLHRKFTVLAESGFKAVLNGSILSIQLDLTGAR